MFDSRTHDWQKEHKLLDTDGKKVWCIHCKKIVDERDKQPDYMMFMGDVYIKNNLPCKPYDVTMK